MYREMTHDSEDEASDKWNRIRKLEMSERIRSFIWVLHHDRLLTNHRISAVGFGVDGCQCCGAVFKSSLHALRDCNKVRGVWESLVPATFHNAFFQMDWQQCLQVNLIGNVNLDMDWCNVWAVGCHTVWGWRNK